MNTEIFIKGYSIGKSYIQNTYIKYFWNFTCLLLVINLFISFLVNKFYFTLYPIIFNNIIYVYYIVKIYALHYIITYLVKKIVKNRINKFMNLDLSSLHNSLFNEIRCDIVSDEEVCILIIKQLNYFKINYIENRLNKLFDTLYCYLLIQHFLMIIFIHYNMI